MIVYRNMPTTVKVSEVTDDRLTALAARVYLKTRKKITKQELVAWLVDKGLADEDALAAHILGIRYPVPDKVWKQFLRRVRDWGVETREEDIDSIVYGAEA